MRLVTTTMVALACVACGDPFAVSEYVVSVPESCETGEGRCGLIVEFHGATMSADQAEANSSLAALGREHSFIVIQPTSGAAPRSSWPTSAAEEAFGFIQEQVEILDVDEDRVHAAGFSAGANATFDLTYAHPEFFASIAPASGHNGGHGPSSTICTQREEPLPVSALYMHGSLDGFEYYRSCMADTVANQIRLGDLEGPEVVSTGELYQRERYAAPDGRTFEVIEHQYTSDASYSAYQLQGHCYPGSDDPGDAPGQLMPYGCDDETEFHWGEEVIAFFEDHPRRAR